MCKKHAIIFGSFPDIRENAELTRFLAHLYILLKLKKQVNTDVPAPDAFFA